MANFPLDKNLNKELKKLTENDPVHADTFNPLFEQLINNDAKLDSTVSSFTSQLAETVKEVNQPSPKTLISEKNNSFFGFIDDDGVKEVKTRLVNIFKTRGVRGSLAIITGDIGTSTRMTIGDVKELYSDGWEILSHTVNHVNLANYNGDENLIENELKTSKETLGSWGIPVEGLVYPQNFSNEQSRRISKKYYKYSTGGIKINTDYNVFDSMGINRIAFGSWTTDNPTVNGNSEKNTLEYYKTCVDYAYDNNLWLVFMTHIVAQDTSYDAMLGELIDYIKSKNGTIGSIKQGFEKFGSRMFAGDIESEYFAVDKDGALRFPLRTKKGKTNGALLTSLITSFEPESVTSNVILSPHAVSNNFPESLAGTLYTHFVNKQYHRFNYQTYHIATTGSIYTRYCLDDTGTAWGKWFLSNGTKIYESNNFLGTSPLSAFPLGMSTSYMWGANATGLPGNSAGLVTTYRNKSNGNDHQVYKKNGTNELWARTTDSNGAFLNWEPVNVVNVNSLITYNTLISAIPIGVNYRYVSGTDADFASFPESAFGILITVKANGSGYGSYQEYHVRNTQRIYKRYWDDVAGKWATRFNPIIMTSGTFANRPPRPYKNQTYRDETSGKVLVCSAEAIINASDVITTQAVWTDFMGVVVN